MALGSISCSQQPRRDETNGSMTMAWRVPKHVACRYAEERGEGRKVRVRAAPSWNPQNVPDPEVMPTVAMSARQAVSAQLLALRQVDEPRPDHGIQVMYVFANDGGGMERSRYFGYSKDIYHFDHFLGGFRNAFPELLNLQDFQIVDEMETGPGEAVVNASIVDRKGAEAGKFAFVMGKRTYGTLKDCWLTDRIERG